MQTKERKLWIHHPYFSDDLKLILTFEKLTHNDSTELPLFTYLSWWKLWREQQVWTGAAVCVFVWMHMCVCACAPWQQRRGETTLAHHLCVCERLPGDACVYLLIWPGVTLMGFGCKHLISFKIWTFIVDIIHGICMQNMSARGQLVNKVVYQPQHFKAVCGEAVATLQILHYC